MATSKGVDWAVFQGPQGKWGLTTDEFAIAQIGGTYGGRLNWQSTYASQIRTILAKGRRAGAYIWYQVGGSQSIAKAALDAFLPHIGLPKGAIVALDYEAGASGSMLANTNAILYGMRRIKAAGYTPLYYSYKPYTLAHVDYKSIVRAFGDCIWVAAYPFLHAVTAPDMRYFPSMEGVALWQFTNKYAHESGLDGNVDLTDITWNGYRKKSATVTVKPEPKKEDDGMPVQKWRKVTDLKFGMVYAPSTVVTYVDNALTIKKGHLDPMVPYPIYEFKHGAVDCGTAWVNAGDVLFGYNPLSENHKGRVRCTQPVTVTYRDGNAVKTRVIKPDEYWAFGVHDGLIDLGNYQTADAEQFELFI